MTKLNASLFSLKATGRLGKLFSLAKRQGRQIIERRPMPTDAKSPAQLFSRHMFNKCIDLWHLLSEAEQLEWESLARPRHMTGYAWYISQCLRPNPGIYLPLQGGTMSGNIDMAKNRVLKLPLPTDDQEAASKKYHDDNKYTDAEADTRIAIHAAIAAAHHARYTNAEAVTAAKTVKLDDFATPNDNADLNASTSRHGLLKKLDNIATNFMNGQGNWAAPAGVGAGEGHITILPVAYDSIVQGTWQVRIHADDYIGKFDNSAAHADGDELDFKVFLAKGTYTLLLIATRYLNSGIVDFDIDDSEVASFDTYFGPTDRNYRFTQTSINVATSGLKTLRMRIDGKNASSGGYVIFSHLIALWRTA